MTVPILDLPFYLESPQTEIFISAPVSKKFIPFFLVPICTDDGSDGSDGPCEDDRPETGMLYPRG